MLAAVLRLAKNILHLLFAHETKHLKNIHFDTKIRSLSKRSFKKKKKKKKRGIDMHYSKAHTFISFTKIRSC